MKPIRKETRERRMERALLVIEGLVMQESGDHTSHAGKVPAGWTDRKYIAHLQQIAADIYCVSHASTGRCCEGGKSRWLDKIPKLERALKKVGLIDVSRCVKGSPKY